MLQAALRSRSKQIAEFAQVGAEDRNADFTFNIPETVAATADHHHHVPRCASAGRAECPTEPPVASQATEEKSSAAPVLTPRRQMGLSPRYLPAVVAAGKNIIADSKDIYAPPPTRDRKKRELRPKDTIATLLTDASHTISELVDEQAKEDEGLEAPDSPLSQLVRRSSKKKAQTVRVNQGAISNVFSPRGSLRPGMEPLAPAAEPDVSAATVEEVVTGQINTEVHSANASDGRVLSENEIQEKNRRTLDWFRNSESVNRASHISVDFGARLSALRKSRRGGSAGSVDSEAAGGIAAGGSASEDTRAASKSSAPPEACAGGRSRSTESHPSVETSPTGPSGMSNLLSPLHATVQRASRDAIRSRTIQ
mmetsp:Transcript_138015/g.257455  ORF Transcript_138015/g.257455 Transcript_138015/m.257455 type:complete len:367 (-) Transcript_138015:132-1232(-)